MLDGGEQKLDQLIADRADPVIAQERFLSRTAYEHLGGSAAIGLIGRTVPFVTKRSLSGVGRLPAGVRVSKYLGVGAAQLDLPGGGHALAESLTPMATRRPSGGYAPVDLALREAGNGFVAKDPATAVSIPKSLASGVSLNTRGVSLTPVSGSGRTLAGNGQLDGGAVVYPNTGTDADTAAKPISTGFEMYDTLRSVASSQVLSFRVGMPAGASLRSAGSAASVVAYGHTLASISAVRAVDADGTEVPVSMSVFGRTLRVTVDHRGGDYRYPIVVDPTVNDDDLDSTWNTNWRFVNGGSAEKREIVGSPGSMEAKAWVKANEWGALVYPTQGESHIYALYMETAASTGSAVESHLAIAGAPPGGSELEKAVWEGSATLAKSYGRAGTTVCVTSCASSGGTAGNVAMYWLNAIENANGSAQAGGTVTAYAAITEIAQANGPTAAVDTTTEHNTFGERNIFFGSGGWLSEHNKHNAALFDESDPGVGVSSVEYTIAGKKWTQSMEWECSSVQCPSKATTSVGVPYGSGVPDGEPTIEFKAFDAMGSSATTSTKLKVDSTAPHEITLSGLPSGDEINDATRNLKLVAHATDGVTGTLSSGVASLALAVDGQEVGGPNGSCSPGPCTATGEWTINGEEFAAGSHTFTVTATDVAGNSAKGETSFTVHHAASVSVGPGKLNPVTGELNLEATDASVTTMGTPLTVTRNYSSREPGAGAQGMFGAPWTTGFGARKLVRDGSYDMTLVSDDGSRTLFRNKGDGRFESPPGDSTLVLKSNLVETEYTLTTRGSSTVFTHVSGDSPSVWRPSFASGSGGTNATQYTYQVIGGMLEPLQELGPVPSGVSCAPSLKPGCRALTFNYATSTTAAGEGPGEWGDYAGRVTRVYFATAEEKEGKTVQVTKTIAQYAYDSKGHLRAVWDPRVSPALKTTYGYDAEGRVVAVSPPGEDSVAFVYGTTAQDVSAGRLVQVVRPREETPLWDGVAPVDTAAPTLSGSTIVNGQMAVSNGTWSNAPVAYGYQWERCSSSGTECKAIDGAISSTYAPVAEDAGHALVVEVTAVNGGGAVVASTSASGAVATVVSEAESVTQSVSSSSFDAVSCVPESTTCAASDAKGNVYYATNVSGTSSATWHSWSGPGVSPSEAIACPRSSLCVLADGEKGGSGGTLYYGTTGGSLTQAYNPSNGVDAISCPSTSFCLAGQDKNGDLGYSTNPGSTSWSPVELGSAGRAIKGVSCLSSSFCAAVDGMGDLHVATSTAKVESSSWTESNIDGTTALNGISCSYAELCVAVDGSGYVLDLTLSESGAATVSKQNIDGANSLTAITCTYRCVAVDDHGNVFVSRDGGRTWIEAYQLGGDLTGVSCASYSLCAVVDTTGHIVTFNPNTSFTEGMGAPAEWGTTIEYGVPASGSLAPYALGSSEAAKWAQTDIAVEGTAIFPSWMAESWPAPGASRPASGYKGATVDYFDSAEHVVNVAEPTGGIATSEYNSYGDVVRTLSPDDREAALKEGSKSAEASQALDTQSTYGSEGTELLSTLGPLHTVKLASGTAVKARKHTVYSYDEGAPAGGPYRLATKVTEGAAVSGEPEADVRTTIDSYGGQNGLGWILGKPTATRVDPSGLDLVHSAVYDPSTGKAVETRTPGAAPPGEETLSGYVYKSSFGSPGSGNGQMSNPQGIAQDPEGNVYVVDTGNDRIDEYSSSGTFIKKFGGVGSSEGGLQKPEGIAIDGEGTIWVVNTGANVIDGFNKEGKYLETIGIWLERPEALAYSPYNERLYVTDGGHDRVEWINPKRESEYGSFGSKGIGNGEFNAPDGIAIDSSGDVWVSDASDARVQKFSPTGEYISQFDGEGEVWLSDPAGLAFDGEGDLLVEDAGDEGVEVFSSSGAYKFQFANPSSEREGLASFGIVLDSSGDAYVTSGGGSVQEWVPAALSHESHGTGGTHGTQTVYYTAGNNPEAPTCGNQPAWAGLLCEKRPAAQPETGGLPNLPVTTVTYNMWDEPLVLTETVGTTTRSKTNVYDEAGRVLKKTVASSVGTPLPSVEYAYNSETGYPTKVKTTAEGTTRETESIYDRLGELTSYRDADGHTTSYAYDDGRLYSATNEAYERYYSYSSTGLPDEIVDWAPGLYETLSGFTASYDAEGNLTAETYPNGMTANRTLDSTGREVGIEYVKTTNCSSGCVWYSQTEYPSIHGQTLSEASNFSSQAYGYDADGRLTTVQDSPSGEGCTTRIYGYDQETNITSLTTRAPGGGGKCATEGGSAVNHSYDSVNRLTDAGIEYNAFGDITKLPAGDAGGSALTSAFYVNGTLASQSQNGETIGYSVDPDGRDRETVSTGTTNSTVTYAYGDEGDQPAWMENPYSGDRTHSVYGFEGELVAVQDGSEAPVLQIQDLHRNIVGTASSSETATGLLSKGDSTEYGVPRTSSPPKFAWQGAFALRTELPSGVVAMGARSYVPGVARFLQPDPIEGGSANAYAYTYGDPIESADPSGESTVATPGWLSRFLDEEAEVATEAAMRRAAEEQAAREEAEEKATEAAEEAATEVYAGNGKKGKATGRADAYSSDSRSCTWSGICFPSQLKEKCNQQCKNKRNKEEEKRKEKEKRKEEEKERFDKELECGHAVSGYHPSEGSARIGEGLYYGGARPKDVYCGSDGGDPTAPCWGDCEGGLEAWQQWPGHERSIKPNEQSIDPPRQKAHSIRA
ncbi:MAG TPA: SMP-30/gluconolactonase/LRE family protein [Solirubrobacteraceae bacterium]|nr:SMP-30/gluconolactonase/LRE family protein [Solirubrobacteraceae bacterium]